MYLIWENSGKIQVEFGQRFFFVCTCCCFFLLFFVCLLKYVRVTWRISYPYMPYIDTGIGEYTIPKAEWRVPQASGWARFSGLVGDSGMNSSSSSRSMIREKRAKINVCPPPSQNKQNPHAYGNHESTKNWLTWPLLYIRRCYRSIRDLLFFFTRFRICVLNSPQSIYIKSIFRWKCFRPL